jgi:SagB-type dehydrogenase family enzyme
VGTLDDAGEVRRYHEATKHSFVSVRTSGHRLDWDNRPHPFKDYPDLEAVALPPELDCLLRLGAGVIRTRELPGGEVYHFRTYASAGALYPVEVYVVRGEGVYHFHPGELVLRRLHDGDHRSDVDEPDAAAVLVLTGILERTAWKYGARGYRHLFWDAGTMLANLLALADNPRLRTGFDPAEVNRLVDVDGEREQALALLAVEGGSRNGKLEQVIRRRGSARNFTLDPIPAPQLVDILAEAHAPIPADLPSLGETVVVANALTDGAAGAYRFVPPDRLELVRAGDFRGAAGYLALEQAHAARAAATNFLLADLDEALERHGARGYRWALLEAGIRAGRLYLGAYARGLGATGLTFYDDDVSRFFGTSKSPMLCVALGPARG